MPTSSIHTNRNILKITHDKINYIRKNILKYNLFFYFFFNIGYFIIIDLDVENAQMQKMTRFIQ